ncbi:hypothetical protein ACFOZ0_24640 [Streptomyces yaanensis]|uniref:Lipoprotein n=1 Tax=Streptomyces yaanensis TaxID=1142239 RepID=A0ABV7SI99_9ACTN|nr:hypothetical protein [Streptomyces sp. CGMCC 4.7035]WNC01383.1 hypothetical protein Q2K21_26845 [Streptomyces sp. CGMCC 4.7035]
MAGRGRVRGVVAGCALLLVGCGGPVAPDTQTVAVQRVLDRRATAVVDQDRPAFLATEARPELATAAAEFDNLRAVPLAAWSYRLTALHRTGDRATADAELRYRVKGYDRAPVTAARALRLTRSDGRWYVSSDEPADKANQQLWEQGVVKAVRGAHSLVLGVGQPHDVLRNYADLADRAVPAVTRAWGADWPGHVVVLVPRSLEGMAGLLGAPASGYRGIAAVTTGEVGGAVKAPADRIIVNPEAYGVLGDLGKQVVLTHETTHVATRAHTTAATPLWLSEGYADWVGYRGSGRTPAQVAPELGRAVALGDVPAALPKDGDFAFAGDAGKLAQAYESGWMACRMIADRWGEARLNEFYRVVGDHQKRAGAVEGALRKVLGTTPEKFTRQWQAYLKAQLG